MSERELKKLKKLMNIKPPKPEYDFIRSKLREKSFAEQIFSPKVVTGNP